MLEGTIDDGAQALVPPNGTLHRHACQFTRPLAISLRR